MRKLSGDMVVHPQGKLQQDGARVPKTKNLDIVLATWRRAGNGVFWGGSLSCDLSGDEKELSSSNVSNEKVH